MVPKTLLSYPKKLRRYPRKLPRGSQDTPRGSQEAPQTSFRHHLESILNRVWTILEGFCLDFGTLDWSWKQYVFEHILCELRIHHFFEDQYLQTSFAQTSDLVASK